MENRLENINKNDAYKVSPLQTFVNNEGKNDVIDTFKYQLWNVWMVPMLLTYGELICLKHQRTSSANNLALFKFISIPLSIVLSNHYYSQLQHKLHYYDALYPHPPQSQIELIRDKLITSQKHN